MKHETNITKNRFRHLRAWILSMLFLFYALFLPTPIALSQNEPDVIDQPYKINGKEVKEHLMEKYKLRKDNVASDLQQTPNGPKGYLSISGREIKTKFMPMEENIQARARAIAKAFLEEEANLLGITYVNEIREVKIETDKGYGGDYTFIRFKRYIDNLELDSVDIRITIGPDETIRSFSAYLVPPPPELYEAVKKKTLVEDEIIRIVEEDLKASAESPETTPFEKSIVKNWLPYIKTMEMKKLAISSPPHVVWKAESGWVYTINAFTGEILNKDPNWRFLR